MARPLRIEFPGAVYHITSRGNERKTIFRDGQDPKVFLNILDQVIFRYNWLCHAYCLMKNHYHLLVETPDGNISIGMRQLNGVYTQRFNLRHGRTGHLFQGRFKAVVVQKDSHLLEACRYVVLNPVRAKMAETPEQWVWSSYGATAGQTNPQPFLTTDWILGRFGSERHAAESAYKKFVRDGMGAESIWKGVRAQSVFGEVGFIEGLSDHLKGRREILEIPKSQRFLDRPDLRGLFGTDVVGDKRKRDARILQAVEEHGYTQKEIADHLRMHFTSISRIVKEMERMTRK